MNQYVCAFRGRRDNYQVPLALAQAGFLDRFITDFYAGNFVQKAASLLPDKWQDKVKFRSEARIPRERVKCLLNTTAVEHTCHYLGFSPAATFGRLDRDFARVAASRARKMKSNLLLYTPYAWEAFLASYQHVPRKILFQFHPHPEFETSLLSQDVKQFPFVQQSYLEETGNRLASEFQIRIKDCWKYADLILCASSFTQKTLLAAGAELSACPVIPYGIDLPELPVKKPQIDSFQVLFVGSGIQRKGLHHLLYAWQQARLPKESLLTLVCRNIDPGIDALIRQTPKVCLLRGVDTLGLRSLYQKSSLFVMPSLTEGFGQVFLEALSYGCPVLGTTNTCLPDLGREEDGVFLAEVANIDHLTYQLEYLADVTTNPTIRQKARRCAERFQWKDFRSQLCSLL